MSFRTILVHCGEDDAAVRAALTLGARFGSAIVGVGALAWGPYLDPALMGVSDQAVQSLRERGDRQLREAEARFRSACSGYRGGPIHWRQGIDFPERAMTDLSRGADLIVAAPAQTGGDGEGPRPVELVMAGGLPVIVTPAGQETVQPRTVMIGWKNSRETRRAIADALPLLSIAEKVVIAHVCEEPGSPAVQAEMADVAARLSRHGVEAVRVTWQPLAAEVDEDLMTIAHGHHADTLVVGAYGHSRLREWALGGVSRNLLSSPPERRVLFSR